MWSTPGQGTLTDRCSRIVWASRKLSRCRRWRPRSRTSPPVREVVGIFDGNLAVRWPSGSRVDRRERVAFVVVDPQRLQVVRGRHVLGQRPHREAVDHLEGVRIDHADGVAEAVGYVDPLPGPPPRRGEHPPLPPRRRCCGARPSPCGAGAAGSRRPRWSRPLLRPACPSFPYPRSVRWPRARSHPLHTRICVRAAATATLRAPAASGRRWQTHGQDAGRALRRR